MRLCLTAKIIIPVCFCLWGLVLPGPIVAYGADTGWNVWLDHTVKKYRLHGEDGTDGSKSLSLAMARNEFEGFQVLIYAAGASLQGVDVRVGDFVNGSQKIDDIHVYRQHYTLCAQKSRIDYLPGSYPDALLPKVDRFYGETRSTFPFDIAAATVQGIWVEIGTTPATRPGIYTATVTVTAADGKVERLPVSLRVWDFVLPSTASYPALYLAHASGILFGHGLGHDLTSETAVELMKTYNRSFLYHRTASWIRGDGYSYRYSWDAAKKKLTILDWNPWERFYVDGIEGRAIRSGPYAGARFPLINLHRAEWVDVNPKIADPDKESATRQYLQQIYDHFEEKGWDPFNYLYVNVSDEPKCSGKRRFRGRIRNNCEIVKLQARDVNSVDTGGKGIWKNVYVHSHNARKGLTDFGEYGFYSPNFASLACPAWDHECRRSRPVAPRENYPGYPHDRIWPYMACDSHGCGITGGKPFTEQMDPASIDAPAASHRMFSFLMWKYQGTGTLFWSVDHNYQQGEGDPYFATRAFGSNGEGTLLYPGITTRSGRSWPGGKGKHTPVIGGSHDIPVASMRWKYIRDCQEDLEYMRLAAARVGKEPVDRVVDSIFANPSRGRAFWTPKYDPDLILALREKIANLITGAPASGK